MYVDQVLPVHQEVSMIDSEVQMSRLQADLKQAQSLVDELKFQVRPKKKEVFLKAKIATRYYRSKCSPKMP